MLSDLLTPWFVLATILVPLVYAERWIHSHLYGVGWLLTKDSQTATILYYVFLFPGVFVHEFVQWLVAGALNVKTKRITAWPEAQDNGTLRLDFVQILETNRISAAVIGAAPLVVGLALVLFISNNILDLEDFLDAISTGDLTIIGPALQELGRTPDFYLWLYIMFAIGNAMLPTPSDRQGWPLLLALFAGSITFLVVIGTGDVLIETFTGPVAHAVDLVATAFGTVLLVEGLAIIGIGFLEEILERTTKRKFEYRAETTEKSTRSRPRPGANTVLRPGQSPPSIYNLNLPVPDPSDAAAAQPSERPVASETPRTQQPVREPAARLETPPRTDTLSPKPEPRRDERPQHGSTATPQRTDRQPLPARPSREASPASRVPAAGVRPFDRRGSGSPPPQKPGPSRESPRRDNDDESAPSPAHRIPDFRRQGAAPEPRQPSPGSRSASQPALSSAPGPRKPSDPDRPFKRPTPFATSPASPQDEDSDEFDDLEYVDFDDL